jgi:putative spermidine/putrescine transport system ATP-binding protein
MLEVVRLGGYGARKPAQLSGGQRQRVALARALVNRPKVLLLDEPLGALDLKLREEMQVELKQIQREVGITFVFVTHDQGEALSMSDRIAVFDGGRLVQVGSPSEVYERPVSQFVAGFVGSSNVISAERSLEWFGVGALHSVRPERIRVADRSADGANASANVTVDVKVVDLQYLGADSRVRCEVAGSSDRLTAVMPTAVVTAAGLAVGQPAHLSFERSAAQHIDS